MSHIFLTSQLNEVARSIAQDLEDDDNSHTAYITTASEQVTDLEWRHKNRQAMVDAGFILTDYTITGKAAGQIYAELSRFDILCIEGGDPFYLLEQIQKTNCKETLRELAKTKTYIGSSAGSIIAGPDVSPARHEKGMTFPNLTDTKGLHLVDVVILPHWGANFRYDIYLKGKTGDAGRIHYNYNQDFKRVTLADDQYLEFKDEWFRFCSASKLL
jgi:dipeptidase E